MFLWGYNHCCPFGMPIAKQYGNTCLNIRDKSVMFLISASKVSNRLNAEDQKK